MGKIKLTCEERDQIAILKAKGTSLREIGRQLERSVSTISDELKRNGRYERGEWVYSAIEAQDDYQKRKQIAGRREPLKNKHVYRYVVGKLQRGWSPELIAGRLKKKNRTDKGKYVNYESIYQYIYHPANRDEGLWEYLARGQKKRKKQKGRTVHRSHIPDRVSIHERPVEINDRTEFGHYEGDTIEGKRSDGNGIHTEVERVSRLLLAAKVETITSEETIKVQLNMFEELPASARKSTTLDNGRENHLHSQLQEIGMKTYFTDPYSSWQRGTNENTNGILRRYFPKKTDFTTITQEELDAVVLEINTRPKKVLQFQTPLEVFTQQLQSVRIQP